MAHSARRITSQAASVTPSPSTPEQHPNVNESALATRDDLTRNEYRNFMDTWEPLPNLQPSGRHGRNFGLTASKYASTLVHQRQVREQRFLESVDGHAHPV